MPLREDLRGIGERTLRFFDAGGDPPFVVYPYPPDEEWHVRRDLVELERWLAAEPRRVGCAAVSLARLFWQALEESGYMEELVAEERRCQGRLEEFSRFVESVGELLRERPTLPDRVITEVKAASQRTAVVLYRAGALYPAYRTSTLLDDLRGRLARPVLLAYPGSIDGEYGLRFMGRGEPSYGYRALIVPREAA